MINKPAILALALLAFPAVALADGQRPVSDRDSTVIAATCDDLRAEVRASHPDCQPLRQIRPAKSQRVVVAIDTQRPVERRRMSRLPWLIGVYN